MFQDVKRRPPVPGERAYIRYSNQPETPRRTGQSYTTMLSHTTNYEKTLEVNFPIDKVADAIKNSGGPSNSTDAYKADKYDDIMRSYSIIHYKIGGYLLNIAFTLSKIDDENTRISVVCSSSSNCTIGHMQINTDQLLSIISAYLSGDTNVSMLKEQANKGCSVAAIILIASTLLTAYATVSIFI